MIRCFGVYLLGVGDAMTNYFAVLGVSSDTDLIGIRRAYKKLPQKYHPDKRQGEKDEANRKRLFSLSSLAAFLNQLR